MATATKPKPKRPAKPRRPAFLMLDELLADLGVTADRVRLDPSPGTATVRDVTRIRKEEGRRFELVDGTLVEKPVSADAAFVAGTLYWLLRGFVEANGRPGMVMPADAFLRISSRFVRAPDLTYTLWDRLPNRKVPKAPIPTLVPDFAVESLSPSNTKAEMARKRREYFDAGVRLVWIIDPNKRTARVYTSPEDVTEHGPDDTLTGGDVLPGFAVRVADLFVDLDDEPVSNPKKTPKKKK